MRFTLELNLFHILLNILFASFKAHIEVFFLEHANSQVLNINITDILSSYFEDIGLELLWGSQAWKHSGLSN